MKPYYDHGGITIWHGDAREVLPTLYGSGASLVCTDPPYSVSVSGSVHVGQKGQGSRNFDFFEGDADWPKMLRRVMDVLCKATHVCAEGAASWYVWCGHRQFGDIVAHLEAWDMQTRFMVWSKTCPAPPPPGSGWANAPSAIPSNVIQADSLRHGMPDKNGHPTQKPLSVIEPLVAASSNADDLVLDPFCGSGTTLDACRRLGRKAIGIEIEERYCEIAAKRLAQEVLDFS